MSLNIQQNQQSGNTTSSGTSGFFSNILIKKFLDILKSVSDGHMGHGQHSHGSHTDCNSGTSNSSSAGTLSNKLMPPSSFNLSSGNQTTSSGQQVQGNGNMMPPPPLTNGSSGGQTNSGSQTTSSGQQVQGNGNMMPPPPLTNGSSGGQTNSGSQTTSGGQQVQGNGNMMPPPPLTNGSSGSQGTAPTSGSGVTNTQSLPASNSIDNTKSTYVYDSKHAPTGDYQISYTTATKGKIYLDKPVVSAGNSVGATSQGAWFNTDATGKSDGTYDTSKKISVDGSVTWPNAKNSNTVSADGSTRTIKTNALPTGTTTGVFPVSTTSAAGKIDPNPNTIKVQDITLVVPTNPKVNAKATAVSTGPIGITTNGIPIFNATDESGKGAVANEVQDSNGTHPQQTGIDHVHNISSSLLTTLLKDDPTKTGVVGYALDGFPITGPGTGSSELFTKDLDANHGINGTYTGADGKVTSGYHYVATQDFPYTVGAFAGTPSKLQGYSSLG